MRRSLFHFLPGLCAAGLLGAVGAASGQAIQTPVRASWPGDSATAATLSWDRRSPGRGTVRYGTTTNYAAVARDGGGTFRHVVDLAGLTPGTRYFYEASSTDGYLQTGTFRTAPAPGQPVHFAIHGDLYGSVNETAAADVANRIAQENPDFVVNVGDMAFEDFTDTGIDTWQAFFRTCSNLLAAAVFMPTMGGHDCAPDYDYPRAVYQRLFALPEPSLGHSCYSFGAARLRFISLNTVLAAAAQDDWLARELQAAANSPDVDWIYVLCHEPPYSWGFRLGTDEYREHWAPLLTRYEADWMFNGHSHNYQRTVPIDGVRYLVAGGGGAGLYESAADQPLQAFATTCYHHVSCRIANDVMQLQAIRSDGLIFDSVAVTNRRQVRVEPAFPLRGQTAKISYRADAGPLAAADPVHLHVGIDDFAGAFHDAPMVWNADRSRWESEFTVPAACTQRLAFVFHDGAGTWHNNHGQNWQALLDRAAIAHLPAAAGAGATLRYEADLGPLAAAADVAARISFWGPGTAAATAAVAMANVSGATWQCTFPVPDSARSLAVHFTSGQALDDNAKRFWTFPVAGAAAAAWPPAPVVAAGSPVLTPNPPGDIPDNVGDNFDLAMLGPPLTVHDAPRGFGDFGHVWLNADATNLYIGGYGLDIGGSNNVAMLFLGLDTLNDNAWNLWHKSGLPNALDFLHNVRFTEPMDVALILGDTFGDGPTYPNFSMGGNGYNSGMGIFYVGTNSGAFVSMAAAKLSQFHGTGTNPCPTGGTSTDRRTARWEAALPWSSLDAASPGAVSNVFVCGVIGSPTVQDNDRYLSRTFLGERAWGLLDSNGQYAFATVNLRPLRVNLLQADLHGGGIPNQWRQDHFGTPGGPGDDEDSDGDGHSNFGEYVAGTGPLDPLSAFALDYAPAESGRPATLSWPVAPGRSYTAYYTPDMLQPFQPLSAAVGTNLPVSATGGYYRLGVRWP